MRRQDGMPVVLFRQYVSETLTRRPDESLGDTLTRAKAVPADTGEIRQRFKLVKGGPCLGISQKPVNGDTVQQ